MNNLDGSLSFAATLDLDDFNASSQAMERRITQVSNTAVVESERMDQSFQSFAENGAKYIVSYLVGQGMNTLIQSIVQTRGEFQQLEIAFETMLKSGPKATQLMGELVQVAAKTPFDLQGIANSAKQMMAYGSSAETVVDELVMLGNVASGVGAPLSDIAYLYGTLRTQGRAYQMDIRQFAGRGIPIYEELAKVMGVTKDQVNALVSDGKVGFAQVEKAFQNLTSSSGMYYNLMEKQSKSLTGMISNLGDAWDGVLNKLGTQNQDLFAGAISSATYLVEHFEDILRIVKAITVAYGSYKAALALNTLVTKGYTGVALLDNTARSAKIALLKLDATLTGQTAKQTQVMTAITTKATAALKAMWASMMTNPVGWVIGLIGALVSVLTLFRSKEEEATDAMGDFQDTTKKEIDALELYFTVLQNAETGTKTHKDAIEKINSVCQEYNKTLLDENATLDQQKEKYAELTTAIQQNTAEKIKAKYAEQALQEMQAEQDKAFEKLTKRAGESTYSGGYTQGMYGGQEIILKSDNLRNASGAVWEMIQAEAIQSANQLKGLTDEAYTEAFDIVLSRLTTMVQQATGASDQEMSGFTASLKTYLTDVVGAAQNAQSELEKIDDQLASFYNNEPETPPAIDYMAMSFAELDKKAKETQDAIDEINKKEVKVESDNEALKTLLATLGQINTALDTKTDNLNTEKGINDRIKQLKEERETVEINSSRYKALTKTITDLEQRLPKNDGQAAKIREKQLEADRQLEEDRIAVMEEGYEKRKATLDLQHKQNMDRIDKEERELAEAMKKAGKGGISQSQRDGFNERRDIENQSYNQATSDLFDEEITYRKEQYQLYFRWVEAMGSDVANKQFANLLKGGASYSQWIDQEIAKLNAKKAENPESFTKGDAENLYSLTIQKDEVMGVRSAMDLFNESVSQAVGQAANLAAKIEAIAKAKEDLAKGKFKLSPDETLEAQNQLDQMDREAQQELNQAVLNDFKSYEERKNEIIANYNAMRLTDIAQNNEELLKRINKGEAEALSALNAEQLQASADWKNLFTNLDVLSAGEIEKLITSIEGQMANADLKLSPVDYQALMESLNQAQEKIVTLNPFKALGSAFKNYIQATKDLKKAEEENLDENKIKAYKKQVESCAKQMEASIKDISSILNTVSDAGAVLASSFGNDELAEIFNGVGGALGGAGQAAGGVAKILSGDLIGGISDCIKGVTQFITSINGMSDAARENNIAELQDSVDALKESYDLLGDAIDQAYSTDKAELLERVNKNLEEQAQKIRQQIEEEKAKKDSDSERIEEWEKEIAEIEAEMAENSKNRTIEAIMGTDVASAIDEFATAYADAWAQGEKAASKTPDLVKNLIKSAILEQLKGVLSSEVDSFMSYLTEAMRDGILSESEEAMLDAYEKKLEGISDGYLSKTGKWLQDDSAAESEDPLKGAVKSLSEETGGVIAGRMNAIVINQSEQTVIMRNSLLYQAEIAMNTKVSAERLAGIESTLKRIENNGNSLLSQGIS